MREGAVLSMGVFIGASTKIVDRDSGEIFQGEVPPYSVVVPGSLPGKPAANGEAGPEPLLRRHRQARRRKDPRQDQHQRTAAGLRPRRAMDWAYLLNSFDGRISRKTFWIAIGRGDHRRTSSAMLHRRTDRGRSAERHRRSRFHLSGIRRSPSSAPTTATCRLAAGVFFVAGALLDLLTVLGYGGHRRRASELRCRSPIAVPFTVLRAAGALLVELRLPQAAHAGAEPARARSACRLTTRLRRSRSCMLASDERPA